MSFRAVEVLRKVSLIAAEDTRHSARLLNHYSIDTPLRAYHDHSSESSQQHLLSLLAEGRDIALISDAGTPLIADPGFKLVRSVRQAGINIVPVPGASAFVAALSVAGLPTDRFSFEGFLPAKSEQRQKRLESLARDTRTLIFYEAPHRLVHTLQAMCDVLGAQRQVVLGRELTKRFETILDGSLSELVQRVRADADQQRGECVLMVEGFRQLTDIDEAEREAERIIRLIYRDLSPKQAASVAAKITGVSKKVAYNLVLSCKDV